MTKKVKNNRLRTKARVRNKISGTAERPRLSVYRSLTGIYAQLIDDNSGVSLAAVSSKTGELKEELATVKTKIAQSTLVGKYLAKKALEAGITAVVFDRNGYRYHGRVQALADGAREGGLKI